MQETAHSQQEANFCPAHFYVISSLEERLNAFGAALKEMSSKIDSISKTLSKLFTEQAVISSNFANAKAASSQMQEDIDNLAEKITSLQLKVVKLSATISMAVSILMLSLGGLIQWLLK